MKWRIGKNFIFTLRQFELHKILLDNLDIFALRDIFAEFFGGLVIRFDGNHLFAAAAQRSGNDARASADIKDGVAFLDIAVSYQKTGEFWPAQEMLAQLVFTHLARAPSGAPLHTLR